ncbi:MAG: hypothetical protein ACUVTL_10895 [Thermoproteota archaeon]
MSAKAKRMVGIVLVSVGIGCMILLPYLIFTYWTSVQGVKTIDEAVSVAEDFLRSLDNKFRQIFICKNFQRRHDLI